MTTEAHAALEVLSMLRHAGIPAWVGGGWAVDALAGRQTRPHTDLDIVIDARNEELLLEVLGRNGFTMKIDWRPGRFLLTSPLTDVDVHPVVFDERGAGTQTTSDGSVYHYPADGFTTGVIDGETVPCLGPDVLRGFHRGYEQRDVDRHDLAILDDL